MKAVCLALLLILSFQLKLASHDPPNPLDGKSFKITGNANDAINDIPVWFTDLKISFKGCNYNFSPYIIISPSHFHAFNFTSTKIACPQDNDSTIQTLLINSKAYQFDGRILTLKDASGKVTLTLQQK